ncbi:glycosyltransferase [Pedobacter psychroterrae]|uniref:Glycosyltransferase n=1 Tax=Pedobacter psychroterrae TaxID=2530453 RepID=A0A4R0N9E6_9SPHI|nr:glycosyltransferase [Pedobacter psychroterrae]TCC96811.1 glycosyltransferase [Pedobacter psychroterrae]
MQSLIIHAWILHKVNGKYFIPYTHWIYLQEIVKHFSKICLISPVNLDGLPEKTDALFSLHEMPSIAVHELPYSGDSYLSSARHFLSYLKGYKSLYRHYDKVYVRYPVPFGWLSMLFFKKADRTIHFVGYPIEVTRLTAEFSSVKKAIMISMFTPEHFLYLKACKGVRVFTNGHQIKGKLAKHGINATAVTSSTLIDSDFSFDSAKQIDEKNIKLIHIGQLRIWKNIDVIIRAFKEVLVAWPGATLTIVGDGEAREHLSELARELNVASQVSFLGHASKRDELIAHLRSHDIFCFSSVAEGSPRVILEAMANGINIVSTPVGSLPFDFEHNRDIIFADANDDSDFSRKINYLIDNQNIAFDIRKKAFEKVKEFTIKTFIKTIFSN